MLIVSRIGTPSFFINAVLHSQVKFFLSARIKFMRIPLYIYCKFSCHTPVSMLVVKEGSRLPILYINNVDITDTNGLQMVMESKRRTAGGNITHWSVEPTTSNRGNVRLVYEDPAGQ